MEDRLSDRLHEELTKTFIDKRASVLARGLKQDMEFKTENLQNNDVKIDDQFIGKIKGLISEDYMRIQLMKLDKLDGNVDSLSNRIANVRTWSYVSNKNNWVENQSYWIEKTKHLEDRLSDRLHEELTKTFIDKRASILARGLKPVSYTHLTLPTNREV